MESYKKLLDILTKQERRNAALLLVMVVVMALLDAVGVASIMPFVAVLSNPEVMETNALIKAGRLLAYDQGYETNQEFIFILGLGFFFIFVFSLSFKALTTYMQIRFTVMCEYSMGKRLVERYLHQPYAWFLNRHGADLGMKILSEIINIIGSAVVPMMLLISHGAVTIVFVALLFFIDWKLTTIVALGLSAVYLTIFLATRGFLVRSGEIRLEANQQRYKSLTEGFSAVKDIKVAGVEETFIQKFTQPALLYARLNAKAQIINQLPRYALEAASFGGILVMVLYLMARGVSFNQALPILTLYALAGYRLMPAIQQIYSALTQLSFATASLDAVHEDLIKLTIVNSNHGKTPIKLKREVKVSKIGFSYPDTEAPALSDMSFTIPARSTIGLVGSTGSGKTTALDLILGLLEPDTGSVLIDGIEVNKNNRRNWQKSIGYVPQQVFLADDTIAANIAFGVEPAEINQATVEQASKVANLHDFVTKQMPDQYHTTIGERGIRLSGGQRQRIGIARALYHNPQVLILDEATSALDNITEQLVMDAIFNLSKKITVIMVAHRMTTVMGCDKIILFDKGKVKGIGTFDELMISNSLFKKLAETK